MPKFTITREGRTIQEVVLDGDRIEFGSARTCPLCIDDLLIRLKQAAFTRNVESETYAIEPLTPTPPMVLNGIALSGKTTIEHGATINIEGYEIVVSYKPDPTVENRGPSAVSKESPAVSDHAREEPPLPPRLEPDLPPPLEDTPPAPAPPPPPALPAEELTPQQAPPSDDQVEEKTRYIQKVGCLVAVSGPLMGQTWDLFSGETPIGRDRSKNRIVIRFDADGQVDTSVSRRHASVYVDGGKITVEDHHSAAGTYVKQRQLVPGQRVELHHGDVIEIRSAKQSTNLRLELDHLPQSASPPPSASPIPEAPRHPMPLDPIPPEQPKPAPEPGFDPISAGSLDPLGVPIPPEKKRNRPLETPSHGSVDNPFLPMEEQKGIGSWPKWIWFVIGIAILFIAGFLFLWLS